MQPVLMRKCWIVYLTMVKTLFCPKLNCLIHKMLQVLIQNIFLIILQQFTLQNSVDNFKVCKENFMGYRQCLWWYKNWQIFYTLERTRVKLKQWKNNTKKLYFYGQKSSKAIFHKLSNLSSLLHRFWKLMYGLHHLMPILFLRAMRKKDNLLVISSWGSPINHVVKFLDILTPCHLHGHFY